MRPDENRDRPGRTVQVVQAVQAILYSDAREDNPFAEWKKTKERRGEHSRKEPGPLGPVRPTAHAPVEWSAGHPGADPVYPGSEGGTSRETSAPGSEAAECSGDGASDTRATWTLSGCQRGLDPDRPGGLDILSKEQVARYREAREEFLKDNPDPTAAHAHAWRVAVSGAD